MAIVTIEDLLRNKKKLEEKAERTLKIEVEELGGEIVVRVPGVAEMMETLEKNVSSMEQAKEIVYYNMVTPNLKDDILITNLKCSSNPIKVVEKVMSEDSIMKISTLIMQEAMGKTSIVKIVDEIKN